MLKPIFQIVPALIADFSNKSGNLRISSYNDPALSCRDLFIGIKRKYPGIHESSYPLTAIFGTNCLAGVNTKVVTPCDLENSFQVRWAAEGMYNHARFCSESYHRLNSAGVQIERVWLNIDEDLL